MGHFGSFQELGADALEVLDELVAANPKAVTSDLRPVLDLCLQVRGKRGAGPMGGEQPMRNRCLAPCVGPREAPPPCFAHIW